MNLALRVGRWFPPIIIMCYAVHVLIYICNIFSFVFLLFMTLIACHIIHGTVYGDCQNFVKYRLNCHWRLIFICPNSWWMSADKQRRKNNHWERESLYFYFIKLQMHMIHNFCKFCVWKFSARLLTDRKNFKFSHLFSTWGDQK